MLNKEIPVGLSDNYVRNICIIVVLHGSSQPVHVVFYTAACRLYYAWVEKMMVAIKVCQLLWVGCPWTVPCAVQLYCVATSHTQGEGGIL